MKFSRTRAFVRNTCVHEVEQHKAVSLSISSSFTLLPIIVVLGAICVLSATSPIPSAGNKTVFLIVTVPVLIGIIGLYVYELCTAVKFRRKQRSYDSA